MICPREVFERARPQEGVRELHGEAIREPLVRAAGAGRKFVNYSSSEVPVPPVALYHISISCAATLAF